MDEGQDCGPSTSAFWGETTEDAVNIIDFDASPANQPGAMTQWERLARSDSLFQRLSPAMKDRLTRNLSLLRHKDYFSGSASSAQIWTQMVQTVNRFTHGALGDVVITISIELLQYRRDHISRLSRGRPHHCSGDIFKRLGADMQNEVKNKMLAKCSLVRAQASEPRCSRLHIRAVFRVWRRFC